jgi:hypothetical protein
MSGNATRRCESCDMLSPHDITFDFFFIIIKQKITKPCKWVGVWFCVFFSKKKKLINFFKKINNYVNSYVFEWQNIISHATST